MFDKCTGYEKIYMGSPPLRLLSLKKGPEGPDDFYGQDDHINKQDAEYHHHGIFLHLLGAFSGFFFQIILLNLPHIEREHLKVHLLIVTAQCADQPPDNIR